MFIFYLAYLSSLDQGQRVRPDDATLIKIFRIALFVPRNADCAFTLPAKGCGVLICCGLLCDVAVLPEIFASNIPGLDELCYSFVPYPTLGFEMFIVPTPNKDQLTDTSRKISVLLCVFT